MKIFIGSDHRGFDHKQALVKFLKEAGNVVTDCGVFVKENCDYPKIAYKVGKAVVETKNSFGILFCMTGIGQSIASNKIKGIRAALCYNIESAQMSRRHNDANILVMGAKFVSIEECLKIAKIWIEEKFEGGRHQKRVNQIREIENR